MSVTDAFRLLNSSLRGIRQDERQHEQNMQKLETDKARLDYEMNDPRRIEERDKAARRIAPVTATSGLVIDADKSGMDQTFAFNKSQEGLNAMLSSSGVELTNKGIMVEKGTLDKAIRPKWRADELRAQIGIYMAMESGKEQMMTSEITELDGKIALMDSTLEDNKRLDPKQRLDRMNWNARASKLRDRRDNPESYAKVLESDNRSNMRSLDIAYRMPTENKELIDMLHNKIKINNTTLNSMVKTGDATKGMKSYSFTTKLPSGEVKTRKEWHKVGAAPLTFTDTIGKWTRGTLKAAPGAGGSGTSRELLNKAKQLTEIDKYTDLLNQRDILGNADKIHQYTMGLVTSGKKTKDQADSIKAMLSKPTRAVIENLNKQISAVEDTYEGKPWFDRVTRKKSTDKAKVKGQKQSSSDTSYKHLWGE